MTNPARAKRPLGTWALGALALATTLAFAPRSAGAQEHIAGERGPDERLSQADHQDERGRKQGPRVRVRSRTQVTASYGTRLAGVDLSLRLSQRIALSLGPAVTAPHRSLPMALGIRFGVNLDLRGAPMQGLYLRAETTALMDITDAEAQRPRTNPALLGSILMGSTWVLDNRFVGGVAIGATTPLTRRIRLEVTMRLSIGVRF